MAKVIMNEVEEVEVADGSRIQEVCEESGVPFACTEGWLKKGHLATNAELVARAVTIVEAMGVQVMTPDEVRDELQLTKRALP